MSILTAALMQWLCLGFCFAADPMVPLKTDISVIWIWHMFNVWQKTYKITSRDVIVQISDNPKFDDAVKTVFNNDTDNSSKLGKGDDKAYIETRFGKPIVLGKPIKGRYVRLYSNGNEKQEANTYVEVEVFGSPSDPVKK